MPDVLPFLKSLLSVAGLSGDEAPVANLITEKWRSLVDEVSVSRVGSLHGLKRGTGKSPRPSVMIAAHMDGIGMRVSKIVDGFLHITNIGGVDDLFGRAAEQNAYLGCVGGGTDSGAIQRALAGIPTVSVPHRYTHSPVSLARLEDWKNTINLLHAALRRITPTLIKSR